MNVFVFTVALLNLLPLTGCEQLDIANVDHTNRLSNVVVLATNVTNVPFDLNNSHPEVDCSDLAANDTMAKKRQCALNAAVLLKKRINNVTILISSFFMLWLVSALITLLVIKPLARNQRVFKVLVW